jgi:hypothetical protein
MKKAMLLAPEQNRDSVFDGYLSIEFVRDCVVDSPEQFDLDTVLANAQRDRRFVESVPGFK